MHSLNSGRSFDSRGARSFCCSSEYRQLNYGGDEAAYKISKSIENDQGISAYLDEIEYSDRSTISAEHVIEVQSGG